MYPNLWFKVILVGYLGINQISYYMVYNINPETAECLIYYSSKQDKEIWQALQ